MEVSCFELVKRRPKRRHEKKFLFLKYEPHDYPREPASIAKAEDELLSHASKIAQRHRRKREHLQHSA